MRIEREQQALWGLLHSFRLSGDDLVVLLVATLNRASQIAGLPEEEVVSLVRYGNCQLAEMAQPGGMN